MANLLQCLCLAEYLLVQFMIVTSADWERDAVTKRYSLYLKKAILSQRKETNFMTLYTKENILGDRWLSSVKCTL